MLKVLNLKVYIFTGKLSKEFEYGTNFLLDDKFNIKHAEILIYIKIKK